MQKFSCEGERGEAQFRLRKSTRCNVQLTLALLGQLVPRYAKCAWIRSLGNRLRCGNFTGELVSRLRSVLRNFRRWKEVVRGGFATGQEEAIVEKSVGEFTGEHRRHLPSCGMESHSGAGYV